MPRPAEYDRTDTLARAMDMFWARGYKATSVRDLVECTGLLPGSLYHAFGDKRGLYLQALQFYAERALRHAAEVLETPGSPLGNIHALLMEIADWPPETKARGSMMCNAIIELAPHDAEVAKLTRVFLQEVQAACCRTLDHAWEAGELPPAADTGALARYLVSSVQGLCVTAKAGVPRADLVEIVEVTMAAVRCFSCPES